MNLAPTTISFDIVIENNIEQYSMFALNCNAYLINNSVAHFLIAKLISHCSLL